MDISNLVMYMLRNAKRSYPLKKLGNGFEILLQSRPANLNCVLSNITISLPLTSFMSTFRQDLSVLYNYLRDYEGRTGNQVVLIARSIIHLVSIVQIQRKIPIQRRVKTNAHVLLKISQESPLTMMISSSLDGADPSKSAR